MNASFKIVLFEFYSYGLNLLYMFMELLPGIFRKLIFKLILRKLGRRGLIDYKTYFRFPSKIDIGNHVMVNRGCEFYATLLNGGADIRIGNHVTFSPHVHLFSAAHDYSTLALDNKVGSITIEDYVWIGSGVIVLPGVTIGEGAVVGAGSIVTKDIPPFTVSVGSPSKVIKQRNVI